MDIDAAHRIAIILHAVTATVCSLAGIVLVVSTRFATSRRLFAVYWWMLVGMVLSLVGAMVAYWNVYTPGSRLTFSGLLLLALYMVYRGHRARRVLEARPAGWRQDHIEHIGFTLISFFEGLVIVAILNLGGAIWLVVLVAALGIVLGRYLLGIAKRRAGSALA